MRFAILIFALGVILTLGVVVPQLIVRPSQPPSPSTVQKSIEKVPASPVTEPVSQTRWPAASTSANIQLAIPATWKKYSKEFQLANFSFFYPPDLQIEDADQSSGDIYLYSQNHDELLLGIARFPYGGWANPSYVQETAYKSGSVAAWFTQLVNSEYNVTRTQADYIFRQMQFYNGKTYYLISTSPTGKLHGLDLDFFSSSTADFYLGIFKGRGIFVDDRRILPLDDLYRIMQSLNVD